VHSECKSYQRLVAERIRCQPYIRKIAGSIPIHVHFATPISKVFDLTMLTVAAIAPPMMAWRAVWVKISQSAQLIYCATVLADYAKIMLLLDRYILEINTERNIYEFWNRK